MEGDLTVDNLEKRKEYKEISTLFSQWKQWQRQFFLCDFTSIVPMNILEIFLTDFEPLYHSGYAKIEHVQTAASLASVTGSRSKMNITRLEHVHESTATFYSKTICDYIQQPNIINIHAISQSIDINMMRDHFLKQLNCLKQMYVKWETFEYIHVIHILLPLCSKDTLKFLSACVNKRVYEHRNLIRFPDRVIETILKYMTPANLCVTAKVCKAWKKLSLKSDVWKISAGEIATSGEMEALGKTAAFSNDVTVWRRIYIELFKQQVNRRQKRLGSILQYSIPAVHQVQHKELTRRRMAVELSDLTAEDSEVDLRMSCLSPDPTSAVPKVLPKKKLILLKSKVGPAQKDFKVGKVVEPAAIERVASFHGSSCELDQTAYEEIVNNKKRHSKKHCTFINKVLGYNDWFSVLSPVYHLKGASELLGHKHQVMCLQFDALRIISGCKEGMIRLWDAKTGRPVRKLQVHQGAITSLQFDGFKLMTSSWDQTVKVFNMTDFTCEATLKGHSESVTKVMFDRQKIISLSVDKTMRVWDRITYECTDMCEGHEGPITGGDMDSENIITCSEDMTVRLWNSTYYHCVRIIQCVEALSCVTVDQELLLIGTLTGRLLFSTKSMVAPSHHILIHEGPVNCMWLYGTRLLTGGADGLVKEWDLPTGSLLRILNGHLASVTCIQASNSVIVTSSHDMTLKMWSLTEIKHI